MNTGDRIKQRRIELGLTADDLAQKIGKSRATIYRYENGDIENMPTPILEPLARALDTTPADLMGWKSTADVPMERVPNKTESVRNSSVSAQCKEIIEVCNQLSPHNQRKVLTYSKNLLSTQQMEEDLLAIHAKTDVEQISEGVLHNLDIMNDDSKWEE